MTHPDQIINFWFNEIESAQWWRVDPSFDSLVKARYGEILQQATRCELHQWRDSAEGRLAEIIVIDQFSRNIHRGHALAFANDALALALAQEAVRAGAPAVLAPVQRAFMYMPFMHSESVAIHAQALRLFDEPGLEFNLQFELRHKAIIDRFGRYPHRNAILGRVSTEEEVEFLGTPGSSF